jgi:hypothetical protein
MLGAFADQDMRDHGLGRQAAADQSFRRGSLDDGAGARSATVFRSAGDENPVLCRNDVEAARIFLSNVPSLVSFSGQMQPCFRAAMVPGNGKDSDSIWMNP